MPYYIKQRIINQIINVIMIAFLMLTLFPVFWMVYCSFKNNTEILLGKIPFGRSGNDVIAMQSEKDMLWIFTSDGKIQKIKKSDFNTEKITSFKTSATSFLLNNKYIWIVSSDKGLLRVEKDNLNSSRAFPYPLKEFDPNKVVSTRIIEDENNLWISMYLRDFESILQFDKTKQKFLKPIDIASILSPSEILSITADKDNLWIGTNKGIVKFGKKSRKVEKSYSSTDLKISSSDIRNLTVDKNILLAGTYSGLYMFNTQNMNPVNSFDINRGLSSDQIESILPAGEFVFVGTNYGLSKINLQNNKVSNYENIFIPLGNSSKDLQMGTVFSIHKDGNSILVGGSAGRISNINPSNGKVISTFKGKDGHLKIMYRNYVDLWNNINFGLYLRNSFIICGITMFIAMILATFAAYALSRFNFPGNKLFGISILATQMIPAIMLLIPIYIMFIKFTEITGIPVKGTFPGLIFVYSAFFIPFSIWILRGFFAAIPIELEEAARIDGCSTFQVFWHIALPLAIPGIIATGIYVFLTAWDELMFAWVLTNADTITIPVGIRYFVGNYQNRFDLMMAAATISTLPVIILFFLLQRHIVKGLTAGAVKG